MAIRCEIPCLLLMCYVFCFNSWKLVRSENPHSVKSDIGRRSVQCLPNEFGENCTYCFPRDSCAAGHYTCDFSTGNKVCLPGWSGKSCRLKIEPDVTFVSCPDNQCRNGGRCVSGQCCCVEGFTGILCEIEIIECKNTSCQHGGICKDLIGRYECLCRDGYTGDQCQIPPSAGTSQTTPSQDTSCRPGTCLNNGTCFEDSMFTYCLCPTWYTGSHCETSLRRKPSEINNTTCPTNYYGQACDKLCIETDSCTDGHYVCDESTGDKVCKSGYIGDKCDTRMLPHSLDPYCPSGLGCKNDGQCFKGTCCCKYNYSGILCQIQSIGCLSSPCGNNGTCTESHGGFECHCEPGYGGIYCEIISQLTYIDKSSSTFPSVDRSSSIVPVASYSQIKTTATPFMTATVGSENIARTTVGFSSYAMPFSSSVSTSAYLDSRSSHTIGSGNVLVASSTENTNHISISKLAPSPLVSSLMVSSSTYQAIISQSYSILYSSNGVSYSGNVQQTSGELGTATVYSDITDMVSRVATNSIDQSMTTVYTSESSASSATSHSPIDSSLASNTIQTDNKLPLSTAHTMYTASVSSFSISPSFLVSEMNSSNISAEMSSTYTELTSSTLEHISNQPAVFVTPGNINAQSVSSITGTSIDLTIMYTSSYTPSESFAGLVSSETFKESQMSSITTNMSSNSLHTYLPPSSGGNSLDSSNVSSSMSIVSNSSPILPIQTTTYIMTDFPLFLNSTAMPSESMHKSSDFSSSTSQTPSSSLQAFNGSTLQSTLTETSYHQLSKYAQTSSLINTEGIVHLSTSQISVSNSKMVPSSTSFFVSIDSNTYEAYSSFNDFKSTVIDTDYSSTVQETISLSVTNSERVSTVYSSTDHLKPSSTSIETRSPSSLTQSVDIIESRSSILLGQTTMIDSDIVSSTSASALVSTIYKEPESAKQSQSTYSVIGETTSSVLMGSEITSYKYTSSSSSISQLQPGQSVLTTSSSASSHSLSTTTVISSSLDSSSTSAGQSIVIVSPTTPTLTLTSGVNYISTSGIIDLSTAPSKRLDTTNTNILPTTTTTNIVFTASFTSTPDFSSTNGFSPTPNASTTHFLTSKSPTPTDDPGTTRDLSTPSSNTFKQSTDNSSSSSAYFPTSRPPQRIVQTDISPTRSATLPVVSGMQSIAYPQNTPAGKTQSDNDALEWWIILIIVLALVMLGLMLTLLVVIVIRKRRSDFRSLEQNPAAITAYDKEHFSIQPDIANPTYEPDDDSDDDSVKTDMYIINN